MFKYIKNMFRRKNKMIDNIEIKEIEFLIENFKISDKLKKMQESINYYVGKHDILNRKRYGMGKNGEMVELLTVPNYKIVDNHYRTILDQKLNYILAKNITLTTKNKEYSNILSDIFNNELLNTLFLIGKNAYLYGLAWLYVYYNEKGKLCFKNIDTREIIPVWKDSEHNELEKVIRIYETSKFNGKNYENFENVEVYTLNGVSSYTLKQGKLSLNEETRAYIKIGDSEYSWSKLPFIAFKSSDLEIPLLHKAKSIQDNINEIISDFKNDMSENNRNTVLVLKNYDGNGGDFRTNLNTFGYISVSGDGGVDTLNIEVNASNYESILRTLEKAMYKNLAGIDLKDDKFGNNPNRMNIQTMYFDIDLDSNAIERELKVSINNLLWFINQHLILTQSKDYSKEYVEIIFNRDIMINETQAIEDCVKSLNVLSLETVIAQHPWVGDVKLELNRKKQEREDFDEDNVSVDYE